MVSNETANITLNYRKKMAEAKWEFLKSFAKLECLNKLSAEDKAYALSHLNPAHITTKDSGRIGHYSMGASFRILISNYILEKSFMKNFSIAPGANDKIADGRFVETLGYPIPKVIKKNIPLFEAINHTGCIIKPITGAAAKGVFLNRGKDFYHLFDKKTYDKESFVRYCDQNKLANFIVETYVGNDGFVRDLKFYMFYGDVGAILEIRRGQDGDRHCYYDSNAKVVETGQYADSLFEGQGFREEEKLCAIELSKAIPSPYIRIDLISNGNNYYVGELTAHPGGFETFNHEWDFIFGKKFIAARARLTEDLLSGKRFDAYLNRHKQSHTDTLEKS